MPPCFLAQKHTSPSLICLSALLVFVATELELDACASYSKSLSASTGFNLDISLWADIQLTGSLITINERRYISYHFAQALLHKKAEDSKLFSGILLKRTVALVQGLQSRLLS